MPKHFAVLATAAALAAGGCARAADEAAAVATPTVRVGRPEAAVGSPLDLTYRFQVAASAPAFTEDYVVFVHFADANGEQMWTDDHPPPRPTRTWKAGEVIEYTRTIFIPKFPYTGPTNIQLGLYSPGSGERLPLAGQDVGMRAYQVASFNMTPQTENLSVTFTDGWHPTEVAEDGALEWQWSRGEGTLAFRNPRQDAALFLQVDQVAGAFDQPQRVEVRHGPTVLDAFALPPGSRELRRIALPKTVLGDADTVEITVAVDKTFVPAAVPALRTSDPRELGIRVFRAYVEPK